MLNKMFVEGQLVRRDLECWLDAQRKRMAAEDGMSQTVENLLWVVAAIAAVGLVVAVIQGFLVSKTAQIK